MPIVLQKKICFNGVKEKQEVEIIKTHIVSEIDIDSYIAAEDTSAFPNEKSFEIELEAIAKKNVLLIPVESINTDCVAELALSGSIKKFNRDNVKVTVGKNLFNKSLEEHLIGMKTGQTKTITVDGADISVSVISIYRKLIPVITDELIKKENIEGIGTIADYREKYFSNQKDQAVIDIANSVLTKIIAQHEFCVDNGEVDFLVEQSMEHCRRLSKEEGKVFEEMTSEELGIRVAAGSIEQFKRNCSKYHTNFLKISAISLKATGKPLESFEINNEAMHGLFSDFKNYVCKKIEGANKK